MLWLWLASRVVCSTKVVSGTLDYKLIHAVNPFIKGGRILNTRDVCVLLMGACCSFPQFVSVKKDDDLCEDCRGKPPPTEEERAVLRNNPLKMARANYNVRVVSLHLLDTVRRRKLNRQTSHVESRVDLGYDGDVGGEGDEILL